jgi:short-subunit dehydrogenase
MKKAIVLGASSGMGKSLSALLVEEGYYVGITGRRIELLESIRQEHPDKYLIKPFDISDTSSIAEKLEELASELGGLDLLVISSGTGDENDSLDFSIENRTIDTNVLGFTCVADWAFRYFEKQKTGHLVAITSIAGLRGNRSAPSYYASKAYQINYLEGLRQKATKSNKQIWITDIRPGLVDTAMAKGEGLFWVMPVDMVVRQIYQAITSKRRIAYVTKRWGLIAKILKLIPNVLYDKM